ncbi:WXG100 family type VII secretion target [Streptomyces morookaense]|uniref:ESAT-6-like protein n=1 Tax=Streptomyces morookaense TaxID=1970 RepID=A0A7Y7EAJ3_STRMO|nr:WXG100 family type VII secretion target [Streptomyces morookaense]NVK81542.1 WXG100 family type VII secretion target [Streptomyces morookaense]GHF55126.1 hypothetical protein GCM10010359_66640 [Streptomyces morookaense]
MSDIKVVYGGMEHTVGGVSAAANVVQQQLDTLWKAVSDVTHGWQGEAADMMQAAKSQWDARAQHIQQVLEDVAKRVDHGSTSYRETDRKAAGLF